MGSSVSPQGKAPFVHWLDGLRDRHAQVRIAGRLVRLQNRNFGRVIKRWNSWVAFPQLAAVQLFLQPDFNE